jgi:hypothetical protein
MVKKGMEYNNPLQKFSQVNSPKPIQSIPAKVVVMMVTMNNDP